jgi:serine/threonine-protein kinase
MPMISPDGRWMAYQSNEVGGNQVFVQAFPDKHVRRQISVDRGGYPAWSRNGHELFFWSYGPHPHLMVAAFEARGDSFVADKPRVWSERVPVFFAATKFYDPAPDGKSVVALMSADTPEEPRDRVTFLLNFFDELRRRVSSNAN